MNCRPQATDVFDPTIHQDLTKIVCRLGVIPAENYNYLNGDVYPVLVDGRLVGYIMDS